MSGYNTLFSPKKWDAAEIETLNALRSSGNTFYEIGKRMGRSRDSVVHEYRFLHGMDKRKSERKIPSQEKRKKLIQVIRVERKPGFRPFAWHKVSIASWDEVAAAYDSTDYSRDRNNLVVRAAVEQDTNLQSVRANLIGKVKDTRDMIYV